MVWPTWGRIECLDAALSCLCFSMHGIYRRVWTGDREVTAWVQSLEDMTASVERYMSSRRRLAHEILNSEFKVSLTTLVLRKLQVFATYNCNQLGSVNFSRARHFRKE